MKKYVTIDDITDVLHKFKQRGAGFILSKLNISGLKRTENTFGQLDYESADWWAIPKVRERWNTLITGDASQDYKSYFVNQFLHNKSGLKLLSLGSGASTHEIELAKYSNFEEIICVDLSKNRMEEARHKADDLGLQNIKFICADINKLEIQKENFDIVFFHASLHHFDHQEEFIKNTILENLKPDGLLVINEFVGATRLQFPKHQLSAINKAIRIIPKEYKTRYKSNILKRKYYGSGIWRMIIADPSECIDSASILPAIHSHFKTVIEKSYGGNILMSALKDISHHFIELNSEKESILEQLFQLEDEYITKHQSDFIFGIYQKIRN